MTEEHRLIKSAKSARGGNVSEASIPEDIEIAARALNMKLHSATELGQRTQWIAEVLLAERESCAKIAESFLRGGINYDYESVSANGIAAAIRRR